MHTLVFVPFGVCMAVYMGAGGGKAEGETLAYTPVCGVSSSGLGINAQ